MKIYLLALLLFTFTYQVKCQNLIQNPDFEMYTACPTGISQVVNANFWISTIFSPDYFNCNFVSYPSFPSSSLAYSGTGFVGFLSYGDLNGSGEAVGQHLNQPLLPNNSYTLTFAAKRPAQGMYATNCGGVAVYGITDTIPVDTLSVHGSQLPNATLLGSTPVIQNTIWAIQQLNFTVSDTINYIVFTIEQAPSCYEYIFLDSINLISNGINAVNDLSESSHFEISPNPSNGFITLSLPHNNSEIIINDIFGRRVLTEKTGSPSFEHYLENEGIYLVSIITPAGSVTRKLIISR